MAEVGADNRVRAADKLNRTGVGASAPILSTMHRTARTRSDD